MSILPPIHSPNCAGRLFRQCIFAYRTKAPSQDEIDHIVRSGVGMFLKAYGTENLRRRKPSDEAGSNSRKSVNGFPESAALSLGELRQTEGMERSSEAVQLNALAAIGGQHDRACSPRPSAFSDDVARMNGNAAGRF
jgi:hypothetical protein